jgi:hypothetical protein
MKSVPPLPMTCSIGSKTGPPRANRRLVGRLDLFEDRVKSGFTVTYFVDDSGPYVGHPPCQGDVIVETWSRDPSKTLLRFSIRKPREL